jgi:hypothetical protein
MAMDEKALSTVTVVAAMALTSFIDRLFPRYRACFPYCARGITVVTFVSAATCHAFQGRQRGLCHLGQELLGAAVGLIR